MKNRVVTDQAADAAVTDDAAFWERLCRQHDDQEFGRLSLEDDILHHMFA